MMSAINFVVLFVVFFSFGLSQFLICHMKFEFKIYSMNNTKSQRKPLQGIFLKHRYKTYFMSFHLEFNMFFCFGYRHTIFIVIGIGGFYGFRWYHKQFVYLICPSHSLSGVQLSFNNIQKKQCLTVVAYYWYK